RELIFKVCDQSLVIDDGEIIKFPDKLEKYFEFSEAMEEQKQRENAKVLQKKKHLEDFIKRFGAKATKAKQAKSKQKQIDRLADIHSKKISYFPKVPIPEAASTGKNILECNSNGLSYPGKKVLTDFELQIFRSQKIAILGENGVGKTTLLKYLAGVLKDNSGETPRYYKNCEPAYFAQHLEDELEPDITLFQQVSKKCSVEISDQEIADTLGHLGFSDLDWQKKVSVLSGGEKMRVVLAWVLLKKSAFLLLDEPTNHLDFQTVEALAEALKETNSCVVFVSHDRSFVNKVAKNIFEITENKLQIYPGNYQDYVSQKRLQRKSTSIDNAKKHDSVSLRKDKINYKDEKKKLEKEKKKFHQALNILEKEMEQIEQEILGLNEQLSKDASFASKENIELLNSKGQLKQAKETKYFEILENLEETDQKIEALLS
ncbi:MAG: ATP-binding cassette domain-containing protein, partial [Bdellovibrionota bacterium]|nr:ATP-binding cassette domain-containing protein [Bdellovibrionota bacterium]